MRWRTMGDGGSCFRSRCSVEREHAALARPPLGGPVFYRALKAVERPMETHLLVLQRESSLLSGGALSNTTLIASRFVAFVNLVDEYPLQQQEDCAIDLRKERRPVGISFGLVCRVEDPLSSCISHSSLVPDP